MTVISKQRALDVLDAYGADPARWPAEEAAGVAQWIAGDADVAAAGQQARSLDAALAQWPEADYSGDDIERVIAAAAVKAQPARRPWMWAGGGLLAASLALAAVLGPQLRAPAPAQTQVAELQSVTDQDLYQMVFSASADGVDEVL
jgi:hypothetical protein